MKRLVLLNHIDKENHFKLLGVFNSEMVEEVIEKYKLLPGFCNSGGQFNFQDIIFSDSRYIWVVSVWNEDDYEDKIIHQKMFATEKDANKFLQSISNLLDYDEYCIDKYIVNEMEWSEGYIVFSNSINDNF